MSMDGIRTMANIFETIEKAMIAATFAEANEHDYARQLLNNEKTSHKRVLLSTNCPIVTDKVLKHTVDLSQRLGASLEVYQILSKELTQDSDATKVEEGRAKLNALQAKLKKQGIFYQYAITDTTLMEELSQLARKRRNILAVVIPKCETTPNFRKRSRQALSNIFKCPVILFES